MSPEDGKLQTSTELKIVQYPHPTLRHKSKPVVRVDAELKSIVASMFDLMYAAKGIGLAANQVDLPIQLFVINTAGKRGEGEERVFINPVLSLPRGRAEAEEGCLSLPGVGAPVTRPEQIHVSAFDLSGNAIEMTADGLLARVIQHEHDHLNGVLFIDRIPETSQRQVELELDEFHVQFNQMRSNGEVLSDEAIHERLARFEARYC